MEVPDLQNRFTYHPPKPEKAKVYEQIRKQCLDLALNLDVWCPESREKSLAITKLEEVVFWANASIARNKQ